jgi:hypothetical protein
MVTLSLDIECRSVSKEGWETTYVCRLSPIKNTNTIKDAHALPQTEEILEGLAGNKYVTVIDMKSGYHNDIRCPRRV